MVEREHVDPQRLRSGRDLDPEALAAQQGPDAARELREEVRAPQVAEIRLTLAQAYMRHKRWDEAIVLLTPLANDPHGRGGAESAQDMLRRIKANR